jgi:hypothetical protein
MAPAWFPRLEEMVSGIQARAAALGTRRAVNCPPPNVKIVPP